MASVYEPWKKKDLYAVTPTEDGQNHAPKSVETVPVSLPVSTAPTVDTGAPTYGSGGGGSGRGQSILPDSATSLPVYSNTYINPAENGAYMQAMEALRAAESQLPTYNNSYAADIDALYAQITGREPFSYDLNSDPLYKQYRQQYLLGGRQAMMDIMGQASALTGGYGSTYSQSVGQQQYNAYLQQLNNVVPTLYENAYNRWQDEGAELYNRYSLTQSMANDEYNKYRDSLSDYWQRVSYAQSNADAAYNKALNDRNWQYQLNRDALSDQQAARDNLLESMGIGYTPTAADAAAAGMSTGEMNAWLSYIAGQNQPKYSGGGGGVWSDQAEKVSNAMQELFDTNDYVNPALKADGASGAFIGPAMTAADIRESAVTMCETYGVPQSERDDLVNAIVEEWYDLQKGAKG